jgi:hypothetical protein
VDVLPAVGASEQIVSLALAGQISVFVLHRLGVPTLHASAVVTAHGVAAFLAKWGQGKSTMTASFLSAGATLLTDDILPLRVVDDEIYVGPGLPLMKLWPEAAKRALGISRELPNVVPDDLIAGYDKKLLKLDGVLEYARRPERLGALYILQRRDPGQTGADEATIQRLSGKEALVALLEHVSRGAFLNPSEIGPFLPIYVRAIRQASVSVLRYPSGFEYANAVRERLLEDLADRRLDAARLTG